MALHIERQVLERILAQAHHHHPLETCGIVASSSNSRVASRIVPMQNQAASETFFRFDSQEQFRVFRELDERDECCRVVYHSHTASEAYPSREDVEYAGCPETHYLIVSTWGKARVPVRSFRLLNGRIIEESLTILE
ncbi:Mov34/MPN/PAD-1 family protein [Stutzerimonas kirkiae]|uniref:Peptidase n=1 Tax=Stutzerimonas kirkiae TaxID=2211392 RepID=A0A4Q9RAG9_9GAMM|nr:M67 family metallopeptidase [Stutzerimonas kirkiae]TBU96796.1 peptidase [Stutzerimonas kirkiae]TBV01036.1 peptidase [Stutzerimonas kirkiae]TBV08384.1 peptidase [Stutzerimonas kirkiae]TBV16655.1 peptidase [Stutzerimonas kirkiae]